MSTVTATRNGPAGDVARAHRTRVQTGRVAHFTRAERAAQGKAARAEVPRSSHAGWEPAPGRRDPVDVLEEQAQTRVPELVPIRYGRMLVSPFTFYRGGAALMAADLAGAPCDRASGSPVRSYSPVARSSSEYLPPRSTSPMRVRQEGRGFRPVRVMSAIRRRVGIRRASKGGTR